MRLFNFFRNTADINTGVAEYKQTTALYCLTLGRQRNTVTGTLTEASTYLLIEFLPLRISSRTKAHRFMCIV